MTAGNKEKNMPYPSPLLCLPPPSSSSLFHLPSPVPYPSPACSPVAGQVGRLPLFPLFPSSSSL